MTDRQRAPPVLCPAVPLTARRPVFMRAVAATIVLAGVASACGSDKAATTTTTIKLPQKVVVSSIAGDSVSLLLAALYAQGLTNAGLRVVRQDPLPDAAAAYAAVKNNTVQIIPGFSGDLLDHLHSIGATPATTTTPPSTLQPTTTLVPIPGDTGATTTTTPLPVGDPHTVADQVAVVKSLLPAELQVSNPSTAERKQVIACSKTATDADTLGTYTDLGAVVSKLILGGPSGFETSTPLGLATLKSSYGVEFKSFVTLDPTAVAAAVKAGTVDCAVVLSTDPSITGESMTPLLDDKALVAPNGALALISTPGATSDVTTAINAVTAKLTMTVLDGMTDQVANKGQSPEYLASLFLQAS